MAKDRDTENSSRLEYSFWNKIGMTDFWVNVNMEHLQDGYSSDFQAQPTQCLSFSNIPTGGVNRFLFGCYTGSACNTANGKKWTINC